MSVPIVLPTMDEAQASSWHAMMELYEKIPRTGRSSGGNLSTCTAPNEVPIQLGPRRMLTRSSTSGPIP